MLYYPSIFHEADMDLKLIHGLIYVKEINIVKRLYWREIYTNIVVKEWRDSISGT